MKTTFFLALAAAVVLTAQNSAPPDVKPQVPRKAENIGIQLAPEKYTWISDYSGKTLIVACILTTCPHCQYTTGVLNHIAKEYGRRSP